MPSGIIASCFSARRWLFLGNRIDTISLEITKTDTVIVEDYLEYIEHGAFTTSSLFQKIE